MATEYGFTSTRMFEHGFIGPVLMGLVGVTCLLMICIITRISSEIANMWPVSEHEREPPIAPYWIPYLQHLPSFLSDPNWTFKSWKQRYPSTPFTLMMMNTRFHIFNKASTASLVFRRSRDFVFEPVLASMMENGLDLPEIDRPKFYMPLKPVHLLTNEELISREFLQGNHLVYSKYLAGHNLDLIMELYVQKFHTVLADLLVPKENDWVKVNYHEMMRRTIFEASVLTFFGTRLQRYWPNMWEDWKAFNDATFAGVRSNLSFYLRPKALRARTRMLNAFQKWCESETEEWPDLDGIWNETWGIKMNWERENLGRKYGFTLRGRACIQAGFLFVIVTNSAPMATWFTSCIFRSEGGVEEYRKEIDKIIIRESDQSQDTETSALQGLKDNQYIQGIWKESLRTGSASAAARVVVKEADIEGFRVKPGSVIMLPVQLMNYNQEVFPEPDKINPWRWILKDDTNEAQKSAIKEQEFNLRSFGGGTSLCSGRFVAEQEIIYVVSIIVSNFDIVFLDPIEEMQLNPCSIGIMSPLQEPIARIRKRKLTEKGE